MQRAIKTPDRSRAHKSTVQANNSTRPDVYAILDRLDKVKENGPGRWLACCPAHQDRSPSLAVRETSDGTILMKCFAGCPTGDVLAAIGLELKDLFPQRDNDAYTASKRPGERWVPRDVLAAVAREALIALLAAEAVHSGTLLSDDDRNRLAVAAGRLRAAAKEVGAHV
ncbi:CHC2 zinc finger domain-containing protein [Vreelandella alkaliphila]|uniref:CHC2 zinc finger domain-containing protein n=1 Tax=Vreelandella alkaliphila TaxID=272774 RepID=A0AAJ2VQJ8_9GAMM|nr:CHC2 zinc finger domain-containing protein [Halomonas alkaliphila]MDX5977744.1 CHC2 zinc finger domain-containing protein [Halomonas alkaliphila]